MITRDGNRLRLDGPLTFANATALNEAMRPQLTGDVVIDLAAVTEVDSAALSLLFEWERIAQHNKCRVTFENLPKTLHSLAALYGVNKLIPASTSA
jgi:phospholipid transport system transporter-binding protein